RATQRTHWKTAESLVEEPQDGEALRYRGTDTATLEVIQLVVVDRPHRAGVGALDVIRLDLEVRDRFRAGALREDEVAVRLVRLGATRRRAQVHEARIHRVSRILDGALEQQVAARVR